LVEGRSTGWDRRLRSFCHPVVPTYRRRRKQPPITFGRVGNIQSATCDQI